MNIKTELQDVFRDTFEDDSIELFDEMTAQDIEDWDSLSHMQLIVAIEKHFNITFTSTEIVQWKNVGEIALSIEKRVAR